MAGFWLPCASILLRIYGVTSKITSNSIGIPSGRLATPSTIRVDSFSSPKTRTSISEAASATLGCSRKSPSVAIDTPSLTIRLTLSSEPKWCRAADSTFRQAMAAALRPSSMVSSAPSRPREAGLPPATGNIPLRKSRLPLCTTSTYAPNGVGMGGSSMLWSCSRCSAPVCTGREDRESFIRILLIDRCLVCRLPFAYVCAAIDVQHLAGNMRRFCQEHNRIHDFLSVRDAAHWGTRAQKILWIVLMHGVSTTPGATLLKRIPSCAYSIARFFEMDSMPPLVIIGTEAVTPAIG